MSEHHRQPREYPCGWEQVARDMRGEVVARRVFYALLSVVVVAAPFLLGVFA